MKIELKCRKHASAPKARLITLWRGGVHRYEEQVAKKRTTMAYKRQKKGSDGASVKTAAPAGKAVISVRLTRL
jgi:hypothetical protein